MTRLAEQSPDPEVRLHAIYEIAAARIRGTADLRPAEPLIRQFIDEVQQSDDPGLLFDASVLIQFCATAAGLGYTDIPMAEAMGWTPLLRRHVDQLLEREWGPNTRAGLLQAAAHLALHVDFTGAEGGLGSATLDDMDRLYGSLMEAIEHGTLQTHLEPAPVVDLDAGMQHLASLVELLSDAPAYPIDAFGDDRRPARADLAGPSALPAGVRRPGQGCRPPGRRRGCRRPVPAARRSPAAGRPAARCPARVPPGQDQLVPRGHPLRRAAGDGLHHRHLRRARPVPRRQEIRTGNGCPRRRSADPSDRELIPMALFSAANMDHLAGAWIASAELATIAGQAHLRWAPDAGNLERHAYVTEAMKYQGFTAVIAEQTRPEFLPAIHDILRGGLFDGFTHPPRNIPRSRAAHRAGVDGLAVGQGRRPVQ